MGRHDLLSVSPRSWKFVVAIHGNEFHHGLNCEVKHKGGSGRNTGWEICEGACWEDLGTWGSHTTGQAPPLPSWECSSATGGHFLLGVIQHNPKHAFICLIHNTMLKGSLSITHREVTINPQVETRQCQVEQEQVDVFSALSQLEDRGFRLETRKLRRTRWRLRKGGGMEKVSHKWTRIEWPSWCIKTSCRTKVKSFSFPQPGYHGGIWGKITKSW